MCKDNTKANSPLYKAKNVLFFLRWICLGFPLNAANDALSQFVFCEWIEYGKYIFFLFVPGLANCWIFYLMLKVTKINNPRLAWEVFNKPMGVSDLDRMTMAMLAPVSYISNHFYFLSFKHNVTGINDVLQSLCETKQYLQCIAEKSKCLATQMKKWRLYRYLIFISIINIFATGMMLSFYFQFVYVHYSKDLTSTEMLLTFMAFLFGILTYIYPGMALSADLFVCTLLTDTTEGFHQFNSLLKENNAFGLNETLHKPGTRTKPKYVAKQNLLNRYDKNLF